VTRKSRALFHHRRECSSNIISVSIKFIPHALRKFKLLQEYGFYITEEEVIEIVKNPGKIMTGKKGRKIAQCKISDDHILRVVFEEKERDIEVITFYPARRERYEN
jgi:hypothetical protein